jgi:hypothetical protein
VWSTNVFDLQADTEQSSLVITGRRLDAEAGPLLYWHANTARTIDRNRFDDIDDVWFFITSTFVTPTPGCWEVTGHLHGEELKVVIDIDDARALVPPRPYGGRR